MSVTREGHPLAHETTLEAAEAAYELERRGDAFLNEAERAWLERRRRFMSGGT